MAKNFVLRCLSSGYSIPLSHGECKFTHTLLQPAFVLSDHAKETVCLHSPQPRRFSAMEPFSCSCECASFDLTISAFDLGSMQLGLSLRGEQKLLDSSADVLSCFSALLSATGCECLLELENNGMGVVLL